MTFSLLGIDTQTGQRVDIPQASRRQGTYIIGANGTGKTGLIENLVIQDIQQGLGIALLDPHGDLTQAVLSRIPDTRENDVISLDIADEDFPFGINLFTCSNPKSSKAVQYVVDQVMHIFDKLFDVDRATPLLSEYLRNCTHTLVVNPGFTMADIPLLLLDATCRKKLVAGVSDPDVLLFWQTYEQMKPTEQRDEAASTLRRVREFLQPLSRNIIGQSTSTIDFRKIMDERKILLVKLDARLPSVTSLIGSVIIALFLNAAYSRQDTEIKKRKQFNLYADEFQRFATEDFATLLTEARKFGIATTIAHQMRDQLDGKNTGATLNVGNLIVLKISGKDAEELAAEFDSTPPAPGVIGQRPMLAPKRDVIEHLVKNGHTNPLVNAFTTTYLARLVDFLREKGGRGGVINLMDERSFSELSMVHADDVRQGIQEFNETLYACMGDRDAQKPISPYTLLAFAFYFRFAEGVGIGAGSYNTNWNHRLRPNQTTLAFCQPDVFKNQATLKSQVLDAAIFGSRKKEAKFQAAMLWITSLREAMEILAKDPIVVDSGQHEPIYDKPRTYADVQNEIATRLANLPKFTAKVKIIDAQDKPVEHTVKTLAPEKGIGKAALQDRIVRIRAQNITGGYVRERTVVEQEIQARQSQNAHSQSQPPISRRGQILVCSKCGTSYRQGARFCGKCGEKI